MQTHKPATESELVDLLIEQLFDKDPRGLRGRDRIATRRFTREQLRLVLKALLEFRRNPHQVPEIETTTDYQTWKAAQDG